MAMQDPMEEAPPQKKSRLPTLDSEHRFDNPYNRTSENSRILDTSTVGLTSPAQPRFERPESAGPVRPASSSISNLLSPFDRACVSDDFSPTKQTPRYSMSMPNHNNNLGNVQMIQNNKNNNNLTNKTNNFIIRNNSTDNSFDRMFSPLSDHIQSNHHSQQQQQQDPQNHLKMFDVHLQRQSQQQQHQQQQQANLPGQQTSPHHFGNVNGGLFAIDKTTTMNGFVSSSPSNNPATPTTTTTTMMMMDNGCSASAMQIPCSSPSSSSAYGYPQQRQHSVQSAVNGTSLDDGNMMMMMRGFGTQTMRTSTPRRISEKQQSMVCSSQIEQPRQMSGSSFAMDQPTPTSGLVGTNSGDFLQMNHYNNTSRSCGSKSTTPISADNEMNGMVKHSPPGSSHRSRPNSAQGGSTTTTNNNNMDGGPSNLGNLNALDGGRIRMLTAQLILLLHAHKCNLRDKNSRDENRSNDISVDSNDGSVTMTENRRHNGSITEKHSKCNVQQCSHMKLILKHVFSCPVKTSCNVPYCSSSKQLIGHWRNCKATDCPVCGPIRSAAETFCTINPAPICTGVDNERLAWQNGMSADIRSNLVRKIVSTILPNADIMDMRMSSLVMFAKKLEAEMYQTAKTQDEYFQLLAKRVFAIRRDIEEKKKTNADENIRLPSISSSLAIMKNGADTSGGNQHPDFHQLNPLSIPMLWLSQSADNNKRLPYNPDASAGEKGPPNQIAPSAMEQRCGNGIQQHSLPHISRDSLSKGVTQFSVHDEVRQTSSQPIAMDDSVEFKVKKETLSTETMPAETEQKIETSSAISIKQEVTMPEMKSEPQEMMPQDDITDDAEDVDTKRPRISPARDVVDVRDMVEIEQHKLDVRDTLNNEVMHGLLTSEDSLPFRQPVDPVVLHIPDYFDIIRRPMDLSTIKKKLDDLEYESPWDFIADMTLMFNNAWQYNKKTSKIYKMCSRLHELFTSLIDETMRKLGYCCGIYHVFLPQVMFCYGNQLCCQIPRDCPYYCLVNTNQQPNLTNDKYTFCAKCFEGFRGETVLVGDDPTMGMVEVEKSLFTSGRNDDQQVEPFVNCKFCGRRWHQICALYHEPLNTDGFACPECIEKRNYTVKPNRFTAANMVNNKLGAYIEKRVNDMFIKNGYNSLVGQIHIRVLASFDKVCEVKPRMKGYYRDRFPESFPFRSKAIFAFEEIDGKDVAFFGLHVQEYGGKAPQPNTRRVYISYLDSVYFFTPKQLRTEVYHEILISYLEWAKRLGYEWGHIWACPPSEGDDYIFYCHPTDQKVPKQKRLIEWYRKMLDRALLSRVVLDYKDAYKYTSEYKYDSVLQLPYFEGDFWPNVFEESIRELQEEAEKRKQEEETAKSSNSGCTSVVKPEVTDRDSPQPSISNKRCQKKKNSAKNKNQRKTCKKSPSGCDLSSKVFLTIEKHRDVFFAIKLSDTKVTAKDDIIDHDPIVPSDLMDGRDAFLNFCRERHYEFSTLRRAKYSTMTFLYELHNQGADKFVYMCNKCRAQVEVRFHCTVCEDYDLCGKCYHKLGHEHKMERLAAGAMDMTSAVALGSNGPGSAGSEGADGSLMAGSSPQVTRQQSIDRCIECLAHAVNCRNANCQFHGRCLKMKRLIQHTKQCANKSTNQCQICRQILMLAHYHTRMCTEYGNCQFPFCVGLKQKMQKQRAQSSQLERRRVYATIQQGNAPAGGTTSQQVASQPQVTCNRNMITQYRPGNNTAQQMTQPQQQQQQQHQHPFNARQTGKGKPTVRLSYQPEGQRMSYGPARAMCMGKPMTVMQRGGVCGNGTIMTGKPHMMGKQPRVQIHQIPSQQMMIRANVMHQYQAGSAGSMEYCANGSNGGGKLVPMSVYERQQQSQQRRLIASSMDMSLTNDDQLQMHQRQRIMAMQRQQQLEHQFQQQQATQQQNWDQMTGNAVNSAISSNPSACGYVTDNRYAGNDMISDSQQQQQQQQQDAMAMRHKQMMDHQHRMMAAATTQCNRPPSSMPQHDLGQQRGQDIMQSSRYTGGDGHTMMAMNMGVGSSGQAMGSEDQQCSQQGMLRQHQFNQELNDEMLGSEYSNRLPSMISTHHHHQQQHHQMVNTGGGGGGGGGEGSSANRFVTVNPGDVEMMSPGQQSGQYMHHHQQDRPRPD